MVDSGATIRIKNVTSTVLLVTGGASPTLAQGSIVAIDLVGAPSRFSAQVRPFEFSSTLLSHPAAAAQVHEQTSLASEGDLRAPVLPALRGRKRRRLGSNRARAPRVFLGPLLCDFELGPSSRGSACPVVSPPLLSIVKALKPHSNSRSRDRETN